MIKKALAETTAAAVAIIFILAEVAKKARTAPPPVIDPNNNKIIARLEIIEGKLLYARESLREGSGMPRGSRSLRRM